MGILIRVPYGDKVKEFHVKEELTLGDWKEMTAIDPKGKDAQYELLSKYTGIPKARLRMVRTGDLDTLMEAMGKALSELQTVRVAELPPLPKTIEHEGAVYTVPQDLNRDTVIGQWWSLEKVDRIEHEADVHIETLNVLLVPEGQEYDAKDRRDIWSRYPMRQAFELASHFFDNGARYRRETLRCTNLFLTSALHRKKQEPKPSPIAMASA